VSIPPGFRLVPDRANRRHDGGRILIGGSPRRVLRLTDKGADAAQRLLAGAVVSDSGEAALARRLLDAGLAHPLPPAEPQLFDVVVPVYDDAAALARCLETLDGVQVTVVDDGSADAAAVRDLADKHRATVVRLERNNGPAAARNRGSAHGAADLVAFVDSDAVVDVRALSRLSEHFADPDVVAVAPRVRAAVDAGGVLGALAVSWSPLDLGPEPAHVHAGGRIAYVPSTVLMVRREPLLAVGGFDESMRYGEDVDLVWRLIERGGCVRYEPAATATHDEPSTWTSWLRRRIAYGTSAAPLAVRHGERAVPLRVQPAPAAALLLAAIRRPALAAAVATGTAARLRRRLRAAAVPSADATVAAGLAPVHASLGVARWATQLWWPAVLLLAARRRGRSRAAVVATVAAPPLLEWRKRRPAVDPIRWTAAVWLDEAAYGVGVWRGCLRARTLRPLFPAISSLRTAARRDMTPTGRPAE